MPIILDYSAEVRPIKVANLIYRAGVLLQDEDHVRWTEAELIDWINEGTIALVRLKPAANARRAVFGLEPGSLQSLDGNVVQLIDIVHNVSGENNVPGRAIRKTERHLLDSTNPNWHNMTPSTTVRHYTYDDRLPTHFYVYPPAASGARVEIVTALLPEDAVNSDDNLSVNLEYADTILNYIVYRCYSKDSEYANAGMATAYYQAYIASMGSGESGEQTSTPTNKVPA
jgi:hypothetical protein